MLTINYIKKVIKARVHSTKYRFSGFCNNLLWRIERLTLRNKDFTLIANNCCGGVISHNLGLKFLSPTVNLFIPHDDFICFLNNFEEAIVAEIQPVSMGGYPVGQIILDKGDIIRLHFVHYKTFEEAVEKWRERCRRINRDNIYVLMELGKETSSDYLSSFHKVPFQNKAAITNDEYSEFPESIFIDIYGPDYIPGKMVDIIPDSPYRYIDLFDYIRWFNRGEIRKSRFYNKYIKK